jgi:hypothetical protein
MYHVLSTHCVTCEEHRTCKWTDAHVKSDSVT